MKLGDFLKVLDSILPIKVYVNGDEYGTYERTEVPEWCKNLELSDVFVDEWYEDIGVSVYT